MGAVNEVMAEKFPGLRVAEAEDTIDDADEEGCDPGSGYSPDQLSSQTPSSCPPHTLRLAVGMPIMATANMPGVGVYNGTWLIITSIVEHRDTGGICFLGCAYVDADGCVCEVDIHHHAAPTNDTEMSFLWTQRQFPVMPCFGMTIKCVSLLLLLYVSAVVLQLSLFGLMWFRDCVCVYVCVCVCVCVQQVAGPDVGELGWCPVDVLGLDAWPVVCCTRARCPPSQHSCAMSSAGAACDKRCLH